MRRLPLVLLLAACHREPAPTLGNHATASPPPVDAPPAPTACERYDAVVQRAVACTALTAEQHHRIEQDRSDTTASIAEGGLDGSERKDPDETCEAAAAEVTKLAATPCGW